MALSKHWREFLELLNSRHVDYVNVGAQNSWTFSFGPLQRTRDETSLHSRLNLPTPRRDS
jgi:hypothetical protein